MNQSIDQSIKSVVNRDSSPFHSEPLQKMAIFTDIWDKFEYKNGTIFDKVPHELLYLVDPYWYSFRPINPLWQLLLGITVMILGIISVSGNFIVIHVFTTTKALMTPSNLLIINLAFADFFMLLTMAPPMVYSCFQETWAFGPLSCEIYGMLGSLWGNASIWSMTMIAFERYVVIVKGLSAKPMTFTKASLEILFVWVQALIWTLLPFFGWNRYVPEGNLAACGTDYLSQDWLSRSYLLVYGFFVFFLPLILIIYSYAQILSTVIIHEKSMREQAKKMNVASLRSGEGSDMKTEIKLAKVALTTISLWFLAWSPYLVINFAGTFGYQGLTPLMTIWGSVFAKANCVYNPIVYGISHPKYRDALAIKYPRLCSGNKDGNGNGNAKNSNDSNSEVTTTTAD